MISTGVLEELLPARLKWDMLRPWNWRGATADATVAVLPVEPVFQFNSRAYDENSGPPASLPSAMPEPGPSLQMELSSANSSTRQVTLTADDERVFSTWGKLDSTKLPKPSKADTSIENDKAKPDEQCPAQPPKQEAPCKWRAPGK